MLSVSITAMIVLTLAFSPRSYGRWLGIHGSASLDAV
jgi:CP family cyanate transporter-like MFS transporter